MRRSSRTTQQRANQIIASRGLITAQAQFNAGPAALLLPSIIIKFTPLAFSSIILCFNIISMYTIYVELRAISSTVKLFEAVLY
jgi:hypothetical protein